MKQEIPHDSYTIDFSKLVCLIMEDLYFSIDGDLRRMMLKETTFLWTSSASREKVGARFDPRNRKRGETLEIVDIIV